MAIEDQLKILTDEVRGLRADLKTKPSPVVHLIEGTKGSGYTLERTYDIRDDRTSITIRNNGSHHTVTAAVYYGHLSYNNMLFLLDTLKEGFIKTINRP